MQHNYNFVLFLNDDLSVFEHPLHFPPESKEELCFFSFWVTKRCRKQ